MAEKSSKERKVSKYRALSKQNEGIRKAQEIADRFQQSVFVRGRREPGISPTAAYTYGREHKRTAGESSTKARIADTMYANYGKFPKPKARPKGKK